MKLRVYLIAVTVGLVTVASVKSAHAQLRDTLEKISGNAVNEGIHKNIGGQNGSATDAGVRSMRRATQRRRADRSIASRNGPIASMS